jgi:hypothetical protein
VKIEAGGAYRQTGSVVSAATGNLDLAADSVVIEAAREDYVQDYRQVFRQSGLTIAVSAAVVEAVKAVKAVKAVESAAKGVGASRDGRVNALSAANAGLGAYRLYEGVSGLASAAAANAGQAATSGLNVSITYGEQKNEQKQHIEQTIASASQALAGGEIRITARGEEDRAGGGDLTIAGSDLAAGGDIKLFARNALNLLAAKQGYRERNRNKSSGWNAGVALSLGEGGWSLGITAGGNVGKGYADADETTWRNSHVESGGEVSLESGAATRLIGAQVKGEEIAIEAKSLTIESLQDPAKFEAEQKNISAQVTVGYGFSASGSYGESEIEADYASVREQSGLFAGDGGYRINVQDNTDLTGALMTSTKAAEAAGKNSLTTGTLTSRNLENHSEYEAEGFSIGASGGFTGGGLGEGYTPQGNTQADANGQLKTGRDSVVVGSDMGYGRDSDEDASVTRSGINTKNITLTDEAAQKSLTGKTAAETVASLHTSTTTETAEQNSGALTNNFDHERVKDEIALQIAVTQQFGQNLHYVQGQFREQEKDLRDQAKAAEAAGDFEQAAKLYGEAKSWQEGEVLLNMLAGGLTAPTNSASGILAGTLAPAASYAIGQYFKEQGTEGSAGHVLAHAILGGAVAAAGGNDALTGALAAGGAEAVAPILSNYLYGKDASDLDPQQKETLSAIAGLAGNAIGGMLGDGASDVIASGQAGKTAVENNSQLGKDLQALIQRLADAEKDKTETPALKGFVQGLTDVTNGIVSLGDASLDTLASVVHCAAGGDYCADGMQYNREKGEALIELGEKIGDGTIGRALIQWGEDLMSDDPARYNAAAEELARASTLLFATVVPGKIAEIGKGVGKANVTAQGEASLVESPIIVPNTTVRLSAEVSLASGKTIPAGSTVIVDAGMDTMKVVLPDGTSSMMRYSTSLQKVLPAPEVASQAAMGGTAASGKIFVTTLSGHTVPIPEGWVGRVADNGKGIVYQRPGATGNADMIRIMDPTKQYPNGYVRYYNQHGQPLDVFGKPGNQATTHIPLDFNGQIPGWPK